MNAEGERSTARALAPARPPRIAYLDALRGLAALTVAAFFHYQHFSSMAQPGGPAPESAPLYHLPGFELAYRYGGFAVDFFFILSGIVFSHVYAEAIGSDRTAWKRFWALRVARLCPIHVATLLAAGGLIWIFHGLTQRFPIYAANGLTDFLLSLTFLQGGILDRHLTFNGPAWSLSVEVFLYLVFFVVARYRVSGWAAVAMLAAGVAILASPVRFMFLANAPIARGLVGFALGMLVYVAAIAGARPIAAALGLAALAAAMFALRTLGGLHDLGFCGVSAALALGLVLISRWRLPQRLLEVPPLLRLGDASLTLYLIHVPVQIVILIGAAWIGWRVPYESLGFWAIYFAAVVGAALMVHAWYERPMRRLLRRRLVPAPRPLTASSGGASRYRG